jgi:hypothetical protein
MAEEKEYRQQDKADEIISAVWQDMKGRPVLTPDEESLFEKIQDYMDYTGLGMEIAHEDDDWEGFIAKYPLVANHIIQDAPWEGFLFETYGFELDHIKVTDPSLVWTLVDGDDSKTYVIAGAHVVNRIGYFISTNPWTDKEEQFQV